MVAASSRRVARRVRLCVATTAVVAGLQLLAMVPAAALPPPPPNPSDSAIGAAQAQANTKAAQVGTLNGRLSAAQAALQNLSDQVELKEENANKALVDLQTAQDAADRAQADADAARVAAAAAGKAIDDLRARVDRFVAGSFAQGSELGSVAAYFGAKNPRDLLERQELLNDLSRSELNVLGQMQQARAAKANADSLARAALLIAQRKRDDARAAKRAADAAIAAAQAAQRSQAAQTARLQADVTDIQQQLTAAQATVAGLKAQRAQYQNWLVLKQQADAAAAAEATRLHGGGAAVPVAAPGSVESVLRRALAEVGMPYAWGGGTANGPSRGIHDGGQADSFGDFNKIGFDCSGLMVYAFAGAGVYLPHFSGYQYTAGTHVPLSAIAPGDMLFWSYDGTPEGIHHVALYIGNGQMVEAFESGTTVRVTSVRYYGGIVPYATRAL
jgi:cell wall-associated NlpC family hydrolase